MKDNASSNLRLCRLERLTPYRGVRKNLTRTGQRKHSLREVFNAVRYVVRCGCPWRMLPNDLPPWSWVYQQMQRWLKAGCFEEMVHDLRVLLRLADGRKTHPSAAIIRENFSRFLIDFGRLV